MTRQKEKTPPKVILPQEVFQQDESIKLDPFTVILICLIALLCILGIPYLDTLYRLADLNEIFITALESTRPLAEGGIPGMLLLSLFVAVQESVCCVFVSPRFAEFLVTLHYPNISEITGYYLVLLLGRTMGARMIYTMSTYVFPDVWAQQFIFFEFSQSVIEAIQHETKKSPIMWICFMRYTFLPEIMKTYFIVLLPNITAGQYVYATFLLNLITLVPKGLSDHYSLLKKKDYLLYPKINNKRLN